MRRALGFSSIALIALAVPATSFASHLPEKKLSLAYPAYDLSDLYVFDGEPGKTVFILNTNPTTKNDGKAAFGDNGLYNIHIATDRAMSGGMTLTFRYSNDSMFVGRIDQPNAALGAEGSQMGIAQIAKETRFANGIRMWVGGTKDLFVGNAVGIQKFRTALREGRYDEHAYDNAEDFFGKLNSSTIVVEMPNAMLPKTIHVFATSAMVLNGRWIQVNRLAHPLLTHLFMLGDEPLIIGHDQHRPDSDEQRRLWVGSTVTRAVALNKSQPDPVAYGVRIADRLLPELMPYEVGTKARYGVDAFNGRRTNDDAMDVAMSIFAGKSVTDGANTFDHHPQQFPYVVRNEPAATK